MDVGPFANSFPTLPKSVHSPIDRTQVEDATNSIRETWKKNGKNRVYISHTP